MLEEKSVQVKILETNDRWFGVTYKEDKEAVQNSFKELIEKGVYPEKSLGMINRRAWLRQALFYAVSIKM